MIFIYVPQINNRIHYIFSFIFECILGLSFQLTNSLELFAAKKYPKISYSSHIIDENIIHYQSSNLLFEEGIGYQKIDNFIQDPFAVCFFLVSRYEEYLPYKKDIHQRFFYQSSVLKDKINISEPFVDVFAYQLFNRLKDKYPYIEKKQRRFNFINTIDLDHAWLYKNHSMGKTIKILFKKIFSFKTNDTVNFIKILFNKQTDPYDIYSFIESLKTPTTYFIPFGKKDKLDTNHSPENKSYQKLILSLKENALNSIGLHPSYVSNSDINILRQEKNNLEKITNHPTYSSRQHFIKLKLPETYQNLIRIGIKKDYTMGYQDHIGFRAGTCTPFYWFDLSQNRTTQLKIYPFSVMDVTLKNYMRLSTEEAKVLLINLINSVKKVEGTFVSIFHNDSLSNYGEWKNWKNVYTKLIEYTQNDCKI